MEAGPAPSNSLSVPAYRTTAAPSPTCAKKLPGNELCSYTLPFGTPKVNPERGPRPPVHPSNKFPSLAPGSRFGFGNNRTKIEVAELREKAIKHKHSTRVDELHLGQRGLAAIPSLRSFVGLQVLWLNGNRLTDSTGLHHAKRLRALYLHDNKIEDVGEDIVGLKNLQKLNLANNDIRLLDPVVNKLKKLLFLTELDLNGNPVTKLLGYRESLIKAMPQLHLLDAMLVTDEERALNNSSTSSQPTRKPEWKLLQRVQRDFKPREEYQGSSRSSDAKSGRRSQSAQEQQTIPGSPVLSTSAKSACGSPGQGRSTKKLKGRLYVNCKSAGGDAGPQVLQLNEYVSKETSLKAQAQADKEAWQQINFTENFRAETQAVMERLSKPEWNEILQKPVPAVETLDMDMRVLEQMESAFNDKARVPESLGTKEDFNNISPVVMSEPTVSYEDACSLVRSKLTKRVEGHVPHPPDEGLVRRLVFQMALVSTPPRPGLPDDGTPGNVDWLCFLCTMAQHLRLRLPRQYVDNKSEELLGKPMSKGHHQDHHHQEPSWGSSPEQARRLLEARRGGIVQHCERAAEKFAKQKNLERAAEMATIHSTAAMICVRKEQRLQDMAKFDLEPCPCTSAPPAFDHTTPHPTTPSMAAPSMGVGGMMALASTRHKGKVFMSTGYVY